MIVSAPGLGPQREADWRPVRLAAVQSFPFFVEHIVGDFYGRENSINSRYGFHRDLAEFISRPRSARKDVTLVICPRGFLKSTYCTILHTIWTLLVDPDETVMLMHGIEKMANSYFEEMWRIITRCPQLKWIAKDIFGADPARDLEAKDNTLRVNCKRGDKVPSVSCYGMKSTTAGHHYSLYKLDDLVNDSNFETPDGIDMPIKKFQAVMNTQRGMRSRVDVMDTVYANDDLTQHLQDPAGLWADSIDVFHRRWYVESRPAWGPVRLKPDGSEFAPGEESWWPEVKPVEFIEKRKKIGPVAFAQQFLCEPAITGARLYRKEWVQRYALSLNDGEEPILPGSEQDETDRARRTWRIDMALDAISGGTTSASKDKACILVGARNDLGQLWLLDLFYARPDNADWYETVHRFWCKWRPQRMPMEQVGVSAALYRALDEDGRRRGARYPLGKSRREGGGVGQSSKTKRAQAIQSFLERGELFMPEGPLWDGPMREITSYQYGIKEQQDDFIDCLYDLWDLPKPSAPSQQAAAEAAWGVVIPARQRFRRPGMREIARR
jgi:hypothetical protein